MATWERRDIPVRTLATGHVLTAPAFFCRGRQEHPLAYIQANVHGGELQGNAAILALFDQLAALEPLGSLVIVPRVNPISANQVMGDWVAGVYDFQTGINFNRGYVPLTGRTRENPAEFYVNADAFAQAHRDAQLPEIREKFRAALRAGLARARSEAATWGTELKLELALAIQELAVEADVVFDLHTGDRAPRYLYIPEGAHAAARALGIPFVLEVPAHFAGALDEAAFVPWQHLSDAYLRLGREDVPRLADGFTVELGSMNSFSLSDAETDARRLVSALRFYGVLEGEPETWSTPQVRCAIDHYRSIYSPASGLLEMLVPPGTAVKAGDLVARVADPSRCRTLPPRSSEAIVDIRVPEDGVVILFHAFSSIMKGARLLSMMTRVGPL